MDRPSFSRIVHALVFALEATMLAVLVVVVVLAIVGLVLQLAGMIHPPFLVGEDLTIVIDDVLAVFVLIELLATAAAYLRGTDVLRRIFEAVFVAIARKLITTHLTEAPLERAAAIAVLMLAAGVTWWLVAHARPTTAVRGASLPPPSPPPP